MGEVWRAYDLKLRVDVALKTLNAALAGERGLELMRGEVRAAREVISPNVCRIFDLIEVDGHELVSMEYVDGHTLMRTLDERGPLDLQEAADVGSQLLSGLEAIHAAGLVHRDIKPENIMLTRARRVVVMDFGLTAREGEGMHAGTPAYMPPEQSRGEGTDARADVFSAGIVLAEMLAVGGDAADVIRHELWKAVRETPPSLPEIPWRRILLKAIATDRDERYESAAAMARTLEKVADPGRRRGRQDSLSGARRLRVRRRPVLLRPRSRSRGAVEETAARPHARSDRPFRRGQEFLRKRRAPTRQPEGLVAPADEAPPVPIRGAGSRPGAGLATRHRSARSSRVVR